MQDTNGIATLNQFRYRGYYFDQENDLYYLQSRYYDPETCRFVNADDISYLDPETIGGLNLYAYCGNNPVMAIDPTGTLALTSFLISLAIGALINWGLSQILGSQISGGIGSIAGGGAAISTGINLLAFGPLGIAAGIALMAIGTATALFGVNEVVAGITGTNYIQSWTGMSSAVYNGLYLGLNIASSVGTIVGNIGMTHASNRILNKIAKNPSEITKYKLWQIKVYGKYTTQWSVGTLSKGGNRGQGYKLTNNQNGLISWSPGSGHHGNVPYWKVSSAKGGVHRFIYSIGIPMEYLWII